MKIRLLIAAAAIPVAAVCAATRAHADQDSYLKTLTGEGLQMTQYDVTQFLQLGYMICNSMSTSHWSEQQMVSRILADAPDTKPQTAQLIVAAAHSQLCPDAG